MPPLAAEACTEKSLRARHKQFYQALFPSGAKPGPLGPHYTSLPKSCHPPSLGLPIETEFAPYQLAQKECSEDAAAYSKQEEAGEVVGPAGMQRLIDGPPALVVQRHGLQLSQCAQHQEDMEELVALPKDMAAAREPALRHEGREESGSQQKEDHLAFVVEKSRVVHGRVGGHEDAVHHGADVQCVGQRRRHLLASAAQQAGLLDVLVVAGASAGKPGEKGSHGQVKGLYLGMPGGLNGVVEVCQGTAKLVHSHTHVVQEEEAVMPELGLGLQEVSQGTEGEVGDGGKNNDEEGQGVQVSPEVHGPHKDGQPQQQHQGRQQVGPDVHRLVVLLEQCAEVEAPGPMQRPVAHIDVWLPEDGRHLGSVHREHRLWLHRRPRHLVDLPQTGQEVAELLGHHCGHGCGWGEELGERPEQGQGAGVLTLLPHEQQLGGCALPHPLIPTLSLRGGELS